MRRRFVALFIVGLALSLLPLGGVLAADLGTRARFIISDTYALPGKEEVIATVRFTGKYADLWIENELWTFFDTRQEGQARELVRIFDEEIYERLVSFWGSEANPGVDDDPKVSILLLELPSGIGGFTSSADVLSKREGLIGNGREMFYVNASILGSGNERAVLAHEFQHVISFNQKELKIGRHEETWVNELRSEYSPQLVLGRILEERVRAFLRNPDDPLGEWKNTSSDYGSVAFFAAYIAERFGVRMFPTLMSRPSVGIPSLEETFWLLSRPAEGFTEVFRDWVLANTLNRLELSDGRYGYRPHPILQGSVLTPSPISLTHSGAVRFVGQVKDWQPRVFRVHSQMDGVAVVKFSSPSPRALMYLEQAFEWNGTIVSSPLWLSRKADGSGEEGTFRIPTRSGSEFLLLFFNERRRVGFSDDDPSYPYELAVSLEPASR